MIHVIALHICHEATVTVVDDDGDDDDENNGQGGSGHQRQPGKL